MANGVHVQEESLTALEIWFDRYDYSQYLFT